MGDHFTFQEIFLNQAVARRVFDAAWPDGREPEEGVSVSFGDVYADVVIRTRRDWQRGVGVKTLSTLGDDYLRVLDRMPKRFCNALYVLRYTGTTATVDHVIQMFAASGVKLIFHKEAPNKHA